MATSAVEDYLKCIYREERCLADGGLVPTGRIAAAMHVTPGTVTSMAKTLTEAGLVAYEPYNGVRLTDAGSDPTKFVIADAVRLELVQTDPDILVESGGVEVADDTGQVDFGTLFPNQAPAVRTITPMPS